MEPSVTITAFVHVPEFSTIVAVRTDGKRVVYVNAAWCEREDYVAMLVSEGVRGTDYTKHLERFDAVVEASHTIAIFGASGPGAEPVGTAKLP